MNSADPEAKLRARLDFYHGHSLDQLFLIRELRLKKSVSERSAFFLAAQMVHHGFPEAISLIDDLRAVSQSLPVREYLDRLEARFKVIQALTPRRRIFQDGALMARLYETEGATLIPHPAGRSDLIVVFLTVYNNFGFSNPVLVALLQQCGFSILLLRDGSRYRFLRGVSRCGETLHELADYISRVHGAGTFGRLFITSYSSGGYASLFTSTLVRPHAYVGFAIESDFSSGGPPVPRTRQAIKLSGEVDGKYLLSLCDRVAASAPPGRRLFFFGEKSDFDRQQCECFEGLPGCSVEMVADSGHEITLDLLERGRLLEIFETVRTSG